MKFNFYQFLIISILIPITFWTNISHAGFQAYNSDRQYKCKFENLNDKNVYSVILFKNPQNELLYIEKVNDNKFEVLKFYKILQDNEDILIATTMGNNSDLENQHKEIIISELVIFKSLNENNSIFSQIYFSLPLKNKPVLLGETSSENPFKFEALKKENSFTYLKSSCYELF